MQPFRRELSLAISILLGRTPPRKTGAVGKVSAANALPRFDRIRIVMAVPKRSGFDPPSRAFLVGYRKVYSVPCAADVVMTSAMWHAAWSGPPMFPCY